MKRIRISRAWMIFSAIALILILGGIAIILGVVAEYEHIIFQHTDHAAVLRWLKMAALYLTIGGGMIVAGAGTLIMAFLRVLRKAEAVGKEAETLLRKNKEMEELYQKTQRLAHHQRLQMIGTLTSSISHEFNNLLTPIMGYSMMALEKLPSDDTELYDGILEIYHTSLKAKEIISRLSDLSRKNTDDTFRQASVDDLIRKTLAVAKPAKPEAVEIKLDLNCWEQRILANEIQICQMVLNLIINGFHAMGEKAGVLSISTSFNETHVKISVGDTGHGIPPEILPDIFTPFFTTKEMGEGTGLGLSIVAQVVEDHQGEIQVETKINCGTTFIISLPRVRTEETLTNIKETYR